MRNWGGILYHVYLKTCRLQASDGRFSAGPGAFNYNINLNHSVILCLLCSCLSCHLSSVGSGFTRSLKANRSSRCPRDNTALFIGYANDRVVKSGVDTGNGIIYILSFLLVRLLVLLATQFPSLNNNFSYFFIVAFFLPAIALLGPFRVRAFVRVRCPLTGRPNRCLSPR